MTDTTEFNQYIHPSLIIFRYDNSELVIEIIIYSSGERHQTIASPFQARISEDRLTRQKGYTRSFEEHDTFCTVQYAYPGIEPITDFSIFR